MNDLFDKERRMLEMREKGRRHLNDDSECVRVAAEIAFRLANEYFEKRPRFVDMNQPREAEDVIA